MKPKSIVGDTTSATIGRSKNRNYQNKKSYTQYQKEWKDKP